jgi:hypothetical protein
VKFGCSTSEWRPRLGQSWLLALNTAMPIALLSLSFRIQPSFAVLPFEIPVVSPFLRRGAFLVQGISTYPKAWAIRRIGILNREQMAAVMLGVQKWLGLAPS